MQVSAIIRKRFYNHDSSTNIIGYDLLQGSPQSLYHLKAPILSLLRTIVLLLNHLTRHDLIIGKDQLRNLLQILVDLPKLRLNLLLIDQRQCLLNTIEVANLLLSIYLSSTQEGHYRSNQRTVLIYNGWTLAPPR